MQKPIPQYIFSKTIQCIVVTDGAYNRMIHLEKKQTIVVSGQFLIAKRKKI